MHELDAAAALAGLNHCLAGTLLFVLQADAALAVGLSGGVEVEDGEAGVLGEVRAPDVVLGGVVGGDFYGPDLEH